jgi:hypothetical protein
VQNPYLRLLLAISEQCGLRTGLRTGLRKTVIKNLQACKVCESLVSEDIAEENPDGTEENDYVPFPLDKPCQRAVLGGNGQNELH